MSQRAVIRRRTPSHPARGPLTKNPVIPHMTQVELLEDPCPVQNIRAIRDRQRSPGSRRVPRVQAPGSSDGASTRAVSRWATTRKPMPTHVSSRTRRTSVNDSPVAASSPKPTKRRRCRPRAHRCGPHEERCKADRLPAASMPTATGSDVHAEQAQDQIRFTGAQQPAQEVKADGQREAPGWRR